MVRHVPLAPHDRAAGCGMSIGHVPHPAIRIREHFAREVRPCNKLFQYCFHHLRLLSSNLASNGNSICFGRIANVLDGNSLNLLCQEVDLAAICAKVAESKPLRRNVAIPNRSVDDSPFVARNQLRFSSHSRVGRREVRPLEYNAPLIRNLGKFIERPTDNFGSDLWVQFEPCETDEDFAIGSGKTKCLQPVSQNVGFQVLGTQMGCSTGARGEQ
ncbi:hypothetical protein CLV88_12827 [Shimia abyssi]|uniref:Uncharacterized protein n=1 Tax=Shimia abyssi TaxID=1662395 RepID=A0A2P8EYM3_9RHOB|nr:hypothetical protein CLV88_12827 [Shimia abyssi]